MHNFKKALIATLSLLLSFATIFLIVIFPCFDPDSQYNDSATRAALSGKMDYIFLGASFTFQAVDTSIIDEELGVCSYNLASPAASWVGRYTLLKKEIERNELDTVVIDVSFDGLVRRASDDKATGEPTIFIKLGDLGESMKYLFDNVSFLNNDVENVISVFMRYGLKAWKDKITGNTGILQRNKGFWPEPTNDVSLKEEKIIETYNSSTVYTNFVDDNIEYLIKTIDLCKQNDIRVIVAVIPIADAEIWKYSNLDEFLIKLQKLCAEKDCPVFDFNLIHNRYDIFDDHTSFTNTTHMSGEGAAAFSKAFCDLIKMVDSNEDISNMFYSSYADLKNESPYMRYYLSNIEN